MHDDLWCPSQTTHRPQLENHAARGHPARSLLAWAAGALVALMLAACGGGQGGGQGFSLALSDAAVTIAPGTSGTVSITITRTGGFAGPVELGVDGLPAGVTAGFSDDPASGASSTLTLTVSAGAAEGSYDLTVTAEAGALSDSAELALQVEAPPGITVKGTVVGTGFKPLAGAAVLILGKSVVLTDAEGAFTVTDVAVPYDVAVTSGSGVERTAVVYQGLTTSTPMLLSQLFGPAVPDDFSATLSGTLSGGEEGFPSGVSSAQRLSFASPETTSTIYANPTTGAYSDTVEWSGQDPTVGNLHALHWERDADNFPVAYLGYGLEEGVALGDGLTVSGQDIALDPVADAVLAGSIEMPAGYTVDYLQIDAQFDDGAHFGLLYDTAAGTTFSHPIPLLAGATISLRVAASHASGASTQQNMDLPPAGRSDLSFELPAPPSTVRPANNATGIDGDTVFEWTPFAGGVHLFIAGPSAAVPGPLFIVFTAAASTTLPDLAALGIAMPANAEYAWTVSGLAPVADMDAIASTALGELLGGADAVSATSAQTFFHTAP